MVLISPSPLMDVRADILGNGHTVSLAWGVRAILMGMAKWKPL